MTTRRDDRKELRQVRDAIHALVARGWDPADVTTAELVEQLSARLQRVADDVRNDIAIRDRIVAKLGSRASS